MGTRAEYTYLNQSIDSASKTITFASLGASDEGSTLPTFTQAPIVEILRTYGDRTFYISSVTTSQFVIKAGDFGAALPISIDFRIVSRETVALTAGAPGTAILWPYYCTVQDVKDRLISVPNLFGTNGVLTNNVVMGLISQVYGDINSALSQGGYTTPITNSNKTTISSGITASNNVVTIPVADDTIFSVGDMVFIHGQTGSTFNAEFAHVVNADSAADTIVVYSLLNNYNSGSTIEKVSEGFQLVRKCNAVGAALEALESTVISQGRNTNDKVTQLDAWYKDCLENLRNSEVNLDDLSAESGLIESYQSQNSSNSDVAPVFDVEMEF